MLEYFESRASCFPTVGTIRLLGFIRVYLGLGFRVEWFGLRGCTILILSTIVTLEEIPDVPELDSVVVRARTPQTPNP